LGAHRRSYAGHRRGSPRPPRNLSGHPIVAVVPARNEPRIADTVRSLLTQTKPVDIVFVVANNCTDNGQTIRDAEAAGAYVINLPNNPHKKAGAINHGLDVICCYYPKGDVAILLMDADTTLPPTWVEVAHSTLRQAYAVSGAYHARPHPGFLGMVQRTEFAQAAHRAAQHPLRVNVLSGTATMVRMSSLRMVRAARKTGILGGKPGDWYDTTSIVEDFEFTLALKKLGLSMITPKGLRVSTDVMETWGALWRQRVRWQEGTLRTLTGFPLRITWSAWLSQVWIYTVAVLPLVVAGLTTWSAHKGPVEWDWRWALITPIIGTAEAWAAKSGGWRCALFAGSVVPMWLVGWFRHAVYWWSLVRALRSRGIRDTVWHEH
jgi:poly-beta-1,6-N-acetyl-D-glucosamine synthase